MHDIYMDFTAAGAMGTIFTLSTLSTSSIEEVAAAAPDTIKWFQLYIYNDRYKYNIVIALAPHSFRTQTKIGLINPTDTEIYFLFCSSLESCDSELSMFIHHTSSEQLAMVTDFLLVFDINCFTWPYYYKKRSENLNYYKDHTKK